MRRFSFVIVAVGALLLLISGGGSPVRAKKVKPPTQVIGLAGAPVTVAGAGDNGELNVHVDDQPVTEVIPGGAGVMTLTPQPGPVFVGVDATRYRTVRLFLWCKSDNNECADVNVSVFNSLETSEETPVQVDNWTLDYIVPPNNEPVNRTYEVPGPNININVHDDGVAGQAVLEYAFVGRTG